MPDLGIHHRSPVEKREDCWVSSSIVIGSSAPVSFTHWFSKYNALHTRTNRDGENLYTYNNDISFDFVHLHTDRTIIDEPLVMTIVMTKNRDDDGGSIDPPEDIETFNIPLMCIASNNSSNMPDGYSSLDSDLPYKCHMSRWIPKSLVSVRMFMEDVAGPVTFKEVWTLCKYSPSGAHTPVGAIDGFYGAIVPLNIRSLV